MNKEILKRRIRVITRAIAYIDKFGRNKELGKHIINELRGLETHRHIAGRGGDLDECHLCGLDLRHEIHA